MFLRKINAALSLLTTVLFLNHAMFLSVWMLSRCSIEKPGSTMAYVMVAVMMLHAVLSIVLAFLGHKGTEKRKCKSYPNLNKATIAQRVSCLLILLLLGFHLAGAANYYQPKMLHAIVQPLFFAATLVHLTVSASKALICLGIGNAKTVKIVDVVMQILCGVTLVASIAGFYLCLFVGVAR